MRRCVPKVSVVVITWNEEGDIVNCLESVVWADEIVVVDSYSSDRTIELCKRYTDKVYQQAWQGYAKQKNYALTKATGEWILSIDADERVTVELRREIKNRVREAGGFDGFYIPRRNICFGAPLMHLWYPNYVLRLFKRGKGHFVERPVHEYIYVDGKVGYLRGHLLHETYKDLSDYFSKFDQFTSLKAKDWHEQGLKTKWYHLLLCPLLKFLWYYLGQQGLRDGYRGLLISILSAFFEFVSYAKLAELEEDGHKAERLSKRLEKCRF